LVIEMAAVVMLCKGAKRDSKTMTCCMNGSKANRRMVTAAPTDARGLEIAFVSQRKRVAPQGPNQYDTTNEAWLVPNAVSR
jgi:hypothetical protein